MTNFKTFDFDPIWLETIFQNNEILCDPKTRLFGQLSLIALV